MVYHANEVLGDLIQRLYTMTLHVWAVIRVWWQKPDYSSIVKARRLQIGVRGQKSAPHSLSMVFIPGVV